MELARRLGWLVVLTAGCGESATTPVGGADLLPPCSDSSPDGGACLRTVSGTIVDDHGAAVDALLLSVCGEQCWYGKTTSDGTFTVEVESNVVVRDYALLLHGRPRGASYYASLATLGGERVSFATPLVLPQLPASGPVIARDLSAQTVTSGDVTLTLAAGTKVSLDVEDVELMQLGQELRALTVTQLSGLPFVDAAYPPTALYALAPFEVLFSQKATLSFANSAKLPAGAAVDVRGMRGLINDTPPAGVFATVAAAHVSADGARIDMDPGEGVTELTWIALFLK